MLCLLSIKIILSQKFDTKSKLWTENKIIFPVSFKSNNIFCGELEISENLDEKDLKFSSLNEKLLKVRDKYGVDIVKYASEHSI